MVKKAMPPAQASRLYSVQALRALAALAIVMQHAFHEASSFNSSPLLPWLESLPWGIGVDVFFIISGFVMMHTAGHKFGGAGAPRTFFIRRLWRIVPPYWFFTTLMVAAALLFAGQLQSTVFTPAHAFQSYLFWPHLNPANPANIHPILGLGWTLVYEMFFYLCFSVALFFRRPVGLLLLTGSFIALFVTARMGLYSPAFNMFWGNSVVFDFLLGILAQMLLASRNAKLNLNTIPALIGFALFALAIATLGNLWSERFFIWGVPGFLLFLSVIAIPLPPRHPATRFWAHLGDTSYTLYLSHPFVLQTAKIALAGFPPALFLTLAPLASIVFSILFYNSMEKKIKPN